MERADTILSKVMREAFWRRRNLSNALKEARELAKLYSWRKCFSDSETSQCKLCDSEVCLECLKKN